MSQSSCHVGCKFLRTLEKPLLPIPTLECTKIIQEQQEEKYSLTAIKSAHFGTYVDASSGKSLP